MVRLYSNTLGLLPAVDQCPYIQYQFIRHVDLDSSTTTNNNDKWILNCNLSIWFSVCYHSLNVVNKFCLFWIFILYMVNVICVVHDEKKCISSNQLIDWLIDWLICFCYGLFLFHSFFFVYVPHVFWRPKNYEIMW